MIGGFAISSWGDLSLDLWVGLGTVLGAYGDILWSIGNKEARVWLLVAPLAGIGCGLATDWERGFNACAAIGLFVGVVGALNAVGAFGRK